MNRDGTACRLLKRFAAAKHATPAPIAPARLYACKPAADLKEIDSAAGLSQIAFVLPRPFEARRLRH